MDQLQYVNKMSHLAEPINKDKITNNIGIIFGKAKDDIHENELPATIKGMVELQ